MRNKFKIGDIVQLKCKSFHMVVADVTKSGYIECVWHDSAGISCQAQYLIEVLELATGRKVGL